MCYEINVCASDGASASLGSSSVGLSVESPRVPLERKLEFSKFHGVEKVREKRKTLLFLRKTLPDPNESRAICRRERSQSVVFSSPSISSYDNGIRLSGTVINFPYSQVPTPNELTKLRFFVTPSLGCRWASWKLEKRSNSELHRSLHSEEKDN